MANELKVCVDCGNEFEFSEKDQAFFKEKGFVPPKRCKTCAKRKRLQRQQENF